MWMLCRRAGGWLSTSVVEHLDGDRPFRLRRLSLILLMAGWVIFAAACLLKSMSLQIVGGVAFTSGLLSVYLFDRRDDARSNMNRRGI
jgi:hypothetical protein